MVDGHIFLGRRRGQKSQNQSHVVGNGTSTPVARSQGGTQPQRSGIAHAQNHGGRGKFIIVIVTIATVQRIVGGTPVSRALDLIDVQDGDPRLGIPKFGTVGKAANGVSAFKRRFQKGGIFRIVHVTHLKGHATLKPLVEVVQLPPQAPFRNAVVRVRNQTPQTLVRRFGTVEIHDNAALVVWVVGCILVVLLQETAAACCDIFKAITTTTKNQDQNKDEAAKSHLRKKRDSTRHLVCYLCVVLLYFGEGRSRCRANMLIDS